MSFSLKFEKREGDVTFWLSSRGSSLKRVIVKEPHEHIEWYYKGSDGWIKVTHNRSLYEQAYHYYGKERYGKMLDHD
jgi:hypothetical protein